MESVLNNPQQVVAAMGGRKVYQSRVDFGSGETYLVRAIVDDTLDPPVVITAYRTSKIDKYWRQP